MKKIYLVGFVVCLLLSFLLYANTLGHGFVLDDWPFLYYNGKLNEGFGAIDDYFKGYYTTDENAYHVYRPVVFALFAVEQALFEGNLPVKHGVNILLFGLGCFLLFAALLKVFSPKQVWAVSAAVLLFMVHPIHVEVVANLKSRDELLVFIGGMGALWAAATYYKDNNWRYLPLVFLGCLLAAFSKKSVFQFILLIPVSMFFLVPKNTSFSPKKCLLLAFILFLGVFCYKWSVWDIKSGVADFIKPTKTILGNPLHEASMGQRITTSWAVMGEYLRLLFVPHRLVYCYGYNYFPVMGTGYWQVWAGLGLHLGLLAYGVWDFFKRKSMLGYGVLFYCIAALAVSNLFKVMPDILANRFIFFGSAGFCIAVAGALSDRARWETGGSVLALSNKRSWGALLVLTSMTLVFSYLTIQRNKAWKNNLTLFETDMPLLGNCARANMFYANQLLLEKGGKKLEEMKADTALARLVIGYAQKAVVIAPDECQTYTVLARAQRAFGRFEDALASSRQCEMRGNDVGAAALLAGETYFQMDSFVLATPLLKKAMQTGIANKKNHELLAWSYFKTEKFDSAHITLDAALLKWPENRFFVREKGKMYFLNKDTTTAFSYLKHASELWPNDPETLHMLALAYLQQGDTLKAKHTADMFNKLMPAIKGK